VAQREGGRDAHRWQGGTSVGGSGTRRRGGTRWKRQGHRWERRWVEEAGVLTGGGAAQGVGGSSARRRGGTRRKRQGRNVTPRVMNSVIFVFNVLILH
jgi:hypothetical protein